MLRNSQHNQTHGSSKNHSNQTRRDWVGLGWVESSSLSHFDKSTKKIGLLLNYLNSLFNKMIIIYTIMANILTYHN